MYEHVTYEDIMARILDRIPAGLDKREGSLIYTAVAPTAAELQLMYIEFDTILKETFADTASRDYLIRRAAERGIYPSKATPAVFQAITEPSNVDISLGERFSIGIYQFRIVKKQDAGDYQVECETPGSAANGQSGMLIPIQHIPGLETATLGALLVPGEDQEDTEEIRRRYQASFNQQSFAGNRQDYIDKTDRISGVGATKVTRAWNGGGTVKLTILNSEYGKASRELTERVQSVIDPKQDGEGDGLAAIDHIVTVDTAEEVAVDFTFRIVFDNGYGYGALQEQILTVLSGYLLELRKSWEDQETTVVRISQVESRLLAIRGILDVGSTTVGGMADNLTLTRYQIPVLGGVVIDQDS